jgi:hypothetical protein
MGQGGLSMDFCRCKGTLNPSVSSREVPLQSDASTTRDWH